MEHGESGVAEVAPMGRANRIRKWFRDRLANPAAVYGLILYSALIAATSDKSSEALEVLILSAISLLIFFLAHVYATTLASHGDRSFRAALAHGIHDSSGMLYASIIPTIPLLLGAFGQLSAEEAVDLALLLVIIVLGVLGYSAFARRGLPIWARILGAIGTALFGFVVFLLNYIVH